MNSSLCVKFDRVRVGVKAYMYDKTTTLKVHCF